MKRIAALSASDSYELMFEKKDSEISELKLNVKALNESGKILRENNAILRSRLFRLKKITKKNINSKINNQRNITTIKNGYRHIYKSKMYALSLWHISPKCYRLFSTSLNLPYFLNLP